MENITEKTAMELNAGFEKMRESFSDLAKHSVSNSKVINEYVDLMIDISINKLIDKYIHSIILSISANFLVRFYWKRKANKYEKQIKYLIDNKIKNSKK